MKGFMPRTNLEQNEESDKKLFWLVTLVAVVLAAILPTLDESDSSTLHATQFRTPASESPVLALKSKKLETLSPLKTQKNLQTNAEQRMDVKETLGVQISPRNEHK